MTRRSTSYRRLARSAAIGLCMIAPPSVAHAQPAEADLLFQEGRTAARGGDWALACTKFAESLKLDPAFGTRLNLAACEEKLGHGARALTLFRELARDLPDGDRRIAEAKQRIDALEARLPRLIVEGPKPARIEENGAAVTASDRGVFFFDPGSHTLAVQTEGEAPRTVVVNLAERATEVLHAGEVRSVREEPAMPAPSPASPRRTLGFVASGIGLAGLALSGATGALALREKGIVESHCDASDLCVDREGIDAKRDGRTYATISTIAFALGAASFATGLVLVLTSRSAAAPASALRLTPAFGGLLLQGSFR